MDGRKDGSVYMDGRKDCQTYGWMDVCMDGSPMNEWMMNGRMDRRTDGLIEGWMEGQKEKWTYGWMDE